MQKLTEGMLLYHGSYTEISAIDLKYSKRTLDFGKGFYLTSSYEQALNYIPSAVKKNIRWRKLPADFKVEDGCISVFRFHPTPELLVHYFETADLDWLHFISANRDDSLFQSLLKEYSSYDIIGGKVADDSTAATLNSYITGEYGNPGSERADNFTISQLLPERLTDQFCFRTEVSIGTLEFVGSERYGDVYQSDFR
ncbi:hypothetical protein CGS46_05295 [Faecalibacterium langellae]|jgi:hypothetical protein|uniref:DUF3990 domain-containing protein n=1 Tax=Faecalibacterium langellae TaxID=3435293 RepID=A0A2A6ZC34_9FIRM|nr:MULTISPECIES: DUF3990 domain-containing protein [Faecalibacterium]PDX58914.1 hypothetical protein CGS46_05295 [Faecalibacterium prausnitzii]UQK38558.1 DUF3990 domain-containing protein [Faecalibacterium sp. I4-3-84]